MCDTQITYAMLNHTKLRVKMKQTDINGTVSMLIVIFLVICSRTWEEFSLARWGTKNGRHFPDISKCIYVKEIFCILVK